MIEHSHNLRKGDRVTIPKGNPYERQKKHLMEAHNQRTTKHRLNKSEQNDSSLPIDSVMNLKSQLNEVKTSVLEMHRKVDSHVHE